MKTKFNGILTLLLALVVQISFAQEKTVSGTVTDDSGSLPGVSVIIKGTNTGTETDFNGKYSINAKVGDVLSFSFLGFTTTEKTIGLSNTVDVTMVEDSNILDEVVVSGVAGATSRKKLSITVAKVSAKDLELTPTSSAASVLQGKVAGVTVTNFGQPGSGSTILLRGSTNLFGSQEPLVLVDGIIVESGLQDLNTDDIASFEIVKGASASALYGSRAGNGVIVITTKKGKIGQVKVTVKSEIGISNQVNKVKLSNSHNYDLATDWGTAQGNYTKYAGVNYPSDYNGSNYQNVTGGRIPSADGYTDNPFGVYYDNQEVFFRSGLDKTLYTSISSASEDTNVYFSAENLSNEGIYRDTKGYERSAVRLNIDYSINDWLKVSAKTNFIKRVNHSPGGGDLFSLTLAEPDIDLTAPNLDGTPYQYVPNLFAATVSNPLYSLYTREPVAISSTFLAAYKMNVKLADWLNFDAEYTMESSNSRNESYVPVSTYRTGGSQEQLYAVYGTGSLFKGSSYSLSQKQQFTFNFNKSWNDLIVKGKLSYLMEDFHTESFGASGSNIIYQGVVSLDNFDSANTRTSSSYSDQRAQNAFAIVGLDYKDRYIFDAMYRMDGSSLFGSKERWNPYYRVSGAYRISEDFKIDNIQELKVHAAYGTAGQRPGFSWQYDRISLGQGGLSTNRTQANPNLLPSETTELEFGLSTRFLDRFNLEAIYSKSKTENQFMLVDIFAPANNGQNKKWDNIGTVEFSTVELSLAAQILKKDFKWDMNFVFSTSNNEITELNVDPIKVGPSNVFRIEEGIEFGSMYGRKFVTNLSDMNKQLPTGKTVDDYAVNSDGIVVLRTALGTTDEKAIILKDAEGADYYGKIGTQNTDFTLGISSTMRYKNFSLYMLWDIKSGGDIYNQNGQWLTRDNRHAMVDQAGKPESEKKTFDYYQSLYDTNEVNGFWVEDASYTRLRELSLFYTLDRETLGGVFDGFFDSIRIGATGKNLLTFTDYSGFDPEVQSYSGGTQQYYAVDLQSYPVYSTYNFSVIFKF
jgi:TonB-linked SusC/RagA family outer membrane protein